MTIKELSEVLGFSERSIRRSIDKYFPGLLQNGKKTVLNELQVTVIKKDIEKHHNGLGDTAELPKTKLEKMFLIKQAMVLLNEELEEAEKQNALLRQENKKLLPKADCYDVFIDSNGLFNIGTVAKELSVKPRVLFQLLRDTGYINSYNVAYQKHVDAGYFEIKNKTVNNTTYPVSMVTPKGIVKIKSLLGVKNV